MLEGGCSIEIPGYVFLLKPKSDNLDEIVEDALLINVPLSSAMRLSIVLSSTVRALLRAEKGVAFLAAVDARLTAHRSGDAVGGDLRAAYWDGISQAAQKVQQKRSEIEQINALATASADAELQAIADEEREATESSLVSAEQELVDSIVPLTEMDVLNKCQIEFTSGAGGQEAMLFTGELLEMYARYTEWRGWKWTPLQMQNSDLGGIRSALIAVEGERAYEALRFEAGVHRVQRIPQTDKSRMHTSTASIAVLPEPEEVSVLVPTDSVKIETMRASGPGGQNVNKRSTAVRLTHKETGLVIAFKRLAAILMQRKVDEVSEKVTSDRKLQVGSKARAEKIRTYNFQHDRVTDHRLQMQPFGVYH
ncbi:putative peptide chain release factor 1 [Ancylostoma duodenale]|uniref:Putative peptide chain release factor 1 n=1 Tax=Ancylostoma duodenale TaxID=51022 RepID=A0A0C2DZE9_9BILA|nr:putative peptide chain release factor 1 [Ancylostoma duodenale]